MHPEATSLDLAKKIFESLEQRTVMVLGAGDTAELAARHLVNQGIARMFIANRTAERAVHLAQALQAKAIPWEAFPEHLTYADIVISSTSAPHSVIDPAMVREAMRARRSRPMFFIDIAVPRDVDPVVNAQLPGNKAEASPTPKPTGVNFIELLQKQNAPNTKKE